MLQRSLGATSLQWLERKAAARGLAFKDDFAPDENADSAPISDSFAEFMWGWYRCAD